MKFSLTAQFDSIDELQQFLAGQTVILPEPASIAQSPDHIPTPAPPVFQEPIPAPTMPNPTVVVSAENNPNLDVNGLPHDPRIHSKNPTFNADGSYRKKKGIDAATFETVAAELRAANAQHVQPTIEPAQPSPPPQPVATPAETMPTPPAGLPAFMQPAAAAPAAAAPAAAAPAAAAPAAAAPAAAAPAAAIDFGGLMQAIGMGMRDKIIDQTYIAALNAHFGIGAVTELGSDPAKLQQYADQMRQDGKLQ